MGFVVAASPTVPDAEGETYVVISMQPLSDIRNERDSVWRHLVMCGLTMRLSDAGLRCRETKLIYPNHRPPRWLTEDAAPRSLEPIVRAHLVDLANRANERACPACWRARGGVRMQEPAAPRSGAGTN